MVQTLALLAMLNLLASACINAVFTVFTITNHVRIPALVTLFSGVLTVTINVVLLNFTSLGVYAIAATGSALSMLRNYIFTPLYGAYCLGVKKSTFYHEIFTGNLCLILNLGVGFLFLHFVSRGETWASLILSAGCLVLVCLAINFFAVLNKEERSLLYTAVRNKCRR